MREIKFRAWFTIEKKMFSVASLIFHYPPSSNLCDIHGVRKEDGKDTYETYYDHPAGTSDKCSPSPGTMILMQFTGLKDKNGKEIYEGDILRWDQVNDIDIVEWMDGDACFRDILNGLSSAHSVYYEVIGNIYENPELLKK